MATKILPQAGDDGVNLLALREDLDSPLTSFWGKTRTARQWANIQGIDQIFSRSGDWVVSDYGLECLTHFYPIEAKRLWQGEGYYGWVEHMKTKRWIRLPDFEAALEAARQRHSGTNKPPPGCEGLK